MIGLSGEFFGVLGLQGYSILSIVCIVYGDLAHDSGQLILSQTSQSNGA